jgi:FkbM family methyltransferase
MLPQNDLWTHLKNTDKKIVMYGMGNGADKILAVCERFGIEVCDFFASDGFVRGHSFHSKTVLSYSALKEKYGAENIIALLSFASSLPDVMENIRRIASECELYAPDVPVCESELFDRTFFDKNEEKFSAAYELLADEESRRIYENVILYKLTGDIRYLDKAVSDKETVYRELLCASDFKCTADLGAYNGDTIRELVPHSPSLKKVFAFEPDRRSFRKLNDYCATVNGSPEIITVNAAAWSEKTLLNFGDEGNRNSGICASGKGAKRVEVEADSLDNILCGECVDYIKYDVEGAERQAIIGSEISILTHRPRLLVSAYHRSEDIFALPLQIHALRPDYKLYLRRYPYIPAWDLNLICV